MSSGVVRTLAVLLLFNSWTGEISAAAPPPTCYTTNDAGTTIIDGNACSGDLTINEGPTSIGNNAFYNNSGITSVTLPNSINTIGIAAFQYTSNMQRIYFGTGLTTISNSAFFGTGLTEIDIPNSVMDLSGVTMFQNSTSLVRATIGSGATIIPSGMFYGTGLREVIIGSSVNEIAANAFEGLSMLTSVTFNGNAPTTVHGTAFSGISASAKVYVKDTATGFPSPTMAPSFGNTWNGMRISRLNPSFTLSSSSETATVGQSINGYSISSIGGAIASYSITPAISNGLSFDTSTGLVSGTPENSAESVTYTITGLNETGSATRTFVLVVNTRAPITTYIPPQPVIFLVSKKPPIVSLSEGKIRCTLGSFEYGTTLDGIEQSRTEYRPIVVTFKLYKNYSLVEEKDVSNADHIEWQILNLRDRDFFHCSSRINYANLTLENISLENKDGLSNVERIKDENIAQIDLRYRDQLQENSSKRLADLKKNRADWRENVDKITEMYNREIANNQSLIGSRAKSKANLATLQKRILGIREITKLYKERQKYIELVFESNKSRIDESRNDLNVKVWQEYSNTLQNTGYGYLFVSPKSS